MTHSPPTRCHQHQQHRHRPPLLRCHCHHYHSGAAVGFSIVPRAHVHTKSKGETETRRGTKTLILTLSFDMLRVMVRSAATKERSTVQLCGSIAYKSNGNYYLAIFPRRACMYCVNVEFSLHLRA